MKKYRIKSNCDVKGDLLMSELIVENKNAKRVKSNYCYEIF